MVALAEAFHRYVIDVPDTTVPFPGDTRVGAEGDVPGFGVGAGVGVGEGGAACTPLMKL